MLRVMLRADDFQGMDELFAWMYPPSPKAQSDENGVTKKAEVAPPVAQGSVSDMVPKPNTRTLFRAHAQAARAAE